MHVDECKGCIAVHVDECVCVHVDECVCACMCVRCSVYLRLQFGAARHGRVEDMREEGLEADVEEAQNGNHLVAGALAVIDVVVADCLD